MVTSSTTCENLNNSTSGYAYNMPTVDVPQVCPHCGHCPTCGRSNPLPNWPYGPCLYPNTTWTFDVSSIPADARIVSATVTCG
jgi:hypothetical protein